MKRFLITLLVLVMLVSCMAITASAAVAGDSFTVTFNSTGNTGFATYGAQINYDSTALELTDISNGTLATNGLFSGPVKTGKVGFIGTTDVTGDGVLFTATFKILDAAVPGATYNVSATLDTATTAKADRTPASFGITGGSVTIDAAPHEHDYATAKYDNTNHWMECSCGDKKDVTAHTLTEDVTVEPGCETKGEKVVTCSGCEYTSTVAIDATGHDYEWVVTKEATCKEEGLKTGTCACGDEITEIIAKTAHTYTSKTEGDYKIYTCTVCGHSYKVDISEYDDVAGTGDITPVIALGVFGMLAAVAFVFKRRAVK